jgi:PEP-CTERM motif
MRRTSLGTLVRLMVFAVLLSPATPASATVIALTTADLSGASLITFNGLTDGTAVNGLSVGGVQFNYLVNNLPSTDARLDGGPGITNNISPLNIVNFNGNANAILRLTFPEPEVRMGYGYAILSNAIVANATTVSLYDASNVLVGTLSVTGGPDPIFAGGFLGLESTIPFVRADLTFSTVGQAFAADNFRFAASAVPEPASAVLFGVGILCASVRRLRKR